MNKSTSRAPQRNKKKYWLTLATGAVVPILVAIVLVFFGKTPVTGPLNLQDADPLCLYVTDTLHMKCVPVLAAESVLGPGNVVANSPSSSSYERVPLPQSNLFSSACQVPGAESEVQTIQSDLAAQSQANSLVFDEFAYTIKRELKVDVDLPVPRYAAIVLKAGPKLNEVQTVTFKAPEAWLKIIDENQLIKLLQHAAISDVCIDRLIAKSYRVISKAAVVQGLNVTVVDKAGKSMSLSAAVKQGKVDVGGSAGTDLDETIKKASEKPLVVGVDFFEGDIFKDRRASLTQPLFSASGLSSVRARGTGGAILGSNTSAPIGQPFSLHSQGTSNINQCGSAVPPSVDVKGELTIKEGPSGRQSYEFVPSGTVVGGTTTRLNFPQGCAITASTVTTDLSFEATIRVVARSSKATQLRVEDNGGYALRTDVRDWTGQSKPRAEAAGDGETHSIAYAISGAGAYQVHVTGVQQVNASGSAAVTTFKKAAFTIEVYENTNSSALVSQIPSAIGATVAAASSSESQQPACQGGQVFINWHRPGNGGEEVTDSPDRFADISNIGSEAVTLGTVAVSARTLGVLSIKQDDCSGRNLGKNERCYVTLTCAEETKWLPGSASINVSTGSSCGSYQVARDVSSMCGPISRPPPSVDPSKAVPAAPTN